MMLMMMGGLFLLIPLLLGPAASSPVPNVSCLIMNLDYIDCTWSGQGSEVNYTFHSRLRDSIQKECLTYLLQNGRVVGCRQTYVKVSKFSKFETNLTHGNTSSVQNHDLRGMVKLFPPVNLSVEVSKAPELWLYWNNSKNHGCMESQVRFRQNGKVWEGENYNYQQSSFSMAFPSMTSRYEFQVRTRVSDACFQSRFWSEWSQPVFWGVESGGVMSVLTPVLSAIVAVVTLVLLACLLVHNERLRIILVPMVPRPKNLEELLNTYGGNVEEWLHISKDLKEGFKPNFTERTCSVRDYRRVSQSASISQSESSISIPIDQSDCTSNPTDQSDCLSTSCYSSTASLPVTLGDQQAGHE